MRTIPKERILRVNCPGFGTQSNWNLGRAKSLNNYTAIIINPTSVIHLFDKDPELVRRIDQAIQEGQTKIIVDDDLLLRNLAAEIDSRVLELSDFLMQGGILVYFLARPFLVQGPSLALDNYYWLESLAPDGSVDRNVRQMSAVSHGRLIELTQEGSTSEFAPYLQQHGLEWSTLVRTDVLTEGYNVLAEAGAKKCIAGQLFIVDCSGRVVFLPAPYSPDFDKTLIDCLNKWYRSREATPEELEAERMEAQVAIAQAQPAAPQVGPVLFDREQKEYEPVAAVATAPAAVQPAPVQQSVQQSVQQIDYAANQSAPALPPSAQPAILTPPDGFAVSADRIAESISQEAHRFEQEVASRMQSQEKKKTGTIDLSVFAQTARQLVEKSQSQEANASQPEEAAPTAPAPPPVETAPAKPPLRKLFGGGTPAPAPPEPPAVSPSSQPPQAPASGAPRQLEPAPYQAPPEPSPISPADAGMPYSPLPTSSSPNGEEPAPNQLRNILSAFPTPPGRSEAGDISLSTSGTFNTATSADISGLGTVDNRSLEPAAIEPESVPSPQAPLRRTTDLFAEEEFESIEPAARPDAPQTPEATSMKSNTGQTLEEPATPSLDGDNSVTANNDADRDNKSTIDLLKELERAQQPQQNANPPASLGESGGRPLLNSLLKRDPAETALPQPAPLAQASEVPPPPMQAAPVSVAVPQPTEPVRNTLGALMQSGERTNQSQTAAQASTTREGAMSNLNVPDWCRQFSFSYLDELKKDQSALANQLQDIQARLSSVESRIASVEQLKCALLGGDGDALKEACALVLGKLGWTINHSNAANNELLLLNVDHPDAIVRLVRSETHCDRSEVAQVAESAISFWERHDVEPKGVLIACTWTNVSPAHRSQKDFEDPVSEFARKKNLCLMSTVQLLGIYRDLELGTANQELVRKQILETSGCLPGFSVESAMVAGRA